MTATGENGVASVPAVVTVDNFDGSMIPGTYVSYSFVASESENCLTVPIAAVMYVNFSNVTLPDDLDAPPAETGGMDDMGDMGDMGDMDDMGDMGDMDMLPEDGALPEDGGMVDSGGAVAVPQRYAGGAFGRKLGAIAIPMPDGGVNGGMNGGSMGGDGLNTIVFVKAKEAPSNAILEPDPAWECPEGFWAVPVEVGLSDNSRTEIKRGLNEGDEVYIGRETQSADSWG